MLYLALSTLLATPVFAQTRPFTVGYINEPESLDFQITRSSLVQRPIDQNFYDFLVGQANDGSPTPTIATWEVTPDGKVWTFHTKPGIKFHDGSPLTAADIAWSSAREAQKYSVYKNLLTDFEGTEIVDNLTVRFKFSAPNAQFLTAAHSLAIESKAYFDKVGDAGLAAHPIGTGAYKFVAYKPGQYVDVAAFEDYRGGAPSIKTARLRFIKDDATRLAALKAGDVDMIDTVPFTDVDAVEKAGFKVISVPTGPVIGIRMYTANPKVPWGDKRVRLAMAEAIDTNAIIKGIFHGIPVNYARLGPGEIGYDPDLKPYKYDPADARKLLAAAGYPNGFTLPLMYSIGTAPGLQETITAVAIYLKAVGITPDLQMIDGSVVNRKVFDASQSKDHDISLVAMSPMPDIFSFDPLLGMTLNFASNSGSSLYANPAYDKALGEAVHTIDTARRGELIKAANRILQDDVASIPIWSNVSTYGMAAKVDFIAQQRNLDGIALARTSVEK